ncbi:MAG: hydrogenase maturation protease, partial [Bifidobacteriaceae bacterium]|nr:hydrogenase maturation protease [Bifidobacteriaceae bacterium]
GGLELLPVVQDAQRLLILDAVRGANPGEVVRLSGDQLPRLLASRLSPHEVGLADVFAAARLLGREPAEIEIVGIVPQEVAAGLDLSPSVAASLDNAVASAVSVIDSWLHTPHPAVV